jgi:phosphate/sulfate permease
MVLLALAALASIFGLTLMNRLSTIDASLDPAGIAATSRIAAILGAVIMIAIAFFPLMYLLQFANKMKNALAANDQEALNDSFLNIKRYFRYLGIIAIIVLAFYALFFVIAIVGIASSR